MRKAIPLLLLCALTAASQTSSPQDKQARDTLDKALQDKNPDTRRQAVIALSLAGSVDPYPSDLQSMLSDKDVEVRLAAISSLVDLNNGNRTMLSLHAALNDSVPEVSFAAARALYTLSNPDGKAALLSVLAGDAKTSSGFLTKQKRDALRMMHTPKTMFLFAIKEGAGLAPVPGLGTGVSSMQALLSDPGTSGRATAALLLGKEKDQQTIDALREALSDKDWSVRAASIHSLALHDDPARQADIAPLIDDKNEPVRLRAAAAYLRLEAVKNRPPATPARKPRARTSAKPAPKKT
ncbi:MAG TPA: HEAT repeat domain-containing protein [Bryobacteraceae bacterium]|nr:HEAT repeat domain-containing protein [Bryobacteraceae bacterium]